MCAEGLEEGCAVCLVLLVERRWSARWRETCTLFIHTRFYGIFVVGFGGVFECLAKVLRCYGLGFLELLHLFLVFFRRLVRGFDEFKEIC